MDLIAQIGGKEVQTALAHVSSRGITPKERESPRSLAEIDYVGLYNHPMLVNSVCNQMIS